MAEDTNALREPVPPPARVIAACFGMSAFAVALITGIFAGNPSGTVLERGLVCLFLGYVLGLIAGEMLAFAIRDYLRQHIAENPIPNSEVSLDDLVGELRVDNLSKSKPNIPELTPEQ